MADTDHDRGKPRTQKGACGVMQLKPIGSEMIHRLFRFSASCLPAAEAGRPLGDNACQFRVHGHAPAASGDWYSAEWPRVTL